MIWILPKTFVQLAQTAIASIDPKIIFDNIYAVLLKYTEHKKHSY